MADNSRQMPPGTVYLANGIPILPVLISSLLTPSPSRAGHSDISGSERDIHGQVVLHPRPSNDPNEPLVNLLHNAYKL